MRTVTHAIDLVAVCDLVWEVVVRCDRLPAPGALHGAAAARAWRLGDESLAGGGGSAANAACGVVLQCPGARVALVGLGGDDAPGRAARAALARAGVVPRVRCVAGRRTKRAAVAVEASTGRTAFGVWRPPRCAPSLGPGEFECLAPPRARLVHVDRVGRAAEWLAHARQRTGSFELAVDLGSFPHRPGGLARLRAVLAACDVLQVGPRAAYALASWMGLPHASPGRLARVLSDRIDWVVVTAAERGAWCAHGGRVEAFPSRAARVFDPTGAGDAVAASLLAARLEGLALPGAVARGMDWAARACAHLGPRTWLQHATP